MKINKISLHTPKKVFLGNDLKYFQMKLGAGWGCPRGWELALQGLGLGPGPLTVGWKLL